MSDETPKVYGYLEGIVDKPLVIIEPPELSVHKDSKVAVSPDFMDGVNPSKKIVPLVDLLGGGENGNEDKRSTNNKTSSKKSEGTEDIKKHVSSDPHVLLAERKRAIDTYKKNLEKESRKVCSASKKFSACIRLSSATICCSKTKN